MPELQSFRGRRVLREMSDNDPVIGAFLFALEMLIRQVEWRVDPGDSDEAAKQKKATALARRQAKQEAMLTGKPYTPPVDADTTTPEDEAAQFVDDCLNDMGTTWPDTLGEILSFLVWGWSFHEILYKKRTGDGSKYSDGKIGWHSWPIRGQESLLRWEFDDLYQPTAMVQMGPPDYQEHIIPIEKGLLFRTTTKRNSPEGRSVLRNAYRPWYYKKHVEQIEGIGIERDLAGLPVAEVPVELLSSAASPDEVATLAAIKKIVTNIRRDEQEGIVWPRAYDENNNPLYELKLLTSGGQRQFDTDKIISRYDQRITMTVLADFIMLGHEQVGTQAVGQTKSKLFTAALGAWLDSIKAVINDQAIPRLLALNGIQTDNPPKLAHGDIERADLDSLGTFLLHLSQAGVELDGSLGGELSKHLMAQAQLPEPDEDATPMPAKWDQAPGTVHIADNGTQPPAQGQPAPSPNAQTQQPRGNAAPSAGPARQNSEDALGVWEEQVITAVDAGESLPVGEMGDMDPITYMTLAESLVLCENADDVRRVFDAARTLSAHDLTA